MQSPLKACLLNPWSVVNKATTLHDFILEYDLDILALTETWLSGTVCDGSVLQEMLPNGYVADSGVELTPSCKGDRAIGKSGHRPPGVEPRTLR